jgi:hypothetical protein
MEWYVQTELHLLLNSRTLPNFHDQKPHILFLSISYKNSGLFLNTRNIRIVSVCQGCPWLPSPPRVQRPRWPDPFRARGVPTSGPIDGLQAAGAIESDDAPTAFTRGGDSLHTVWRGSQSCHPPTSRCRVANCGGDLCSCKISKDASTLGKNHRGTWRDDQAEEVADPC